MKKYSSYSAMIFVFSVFLFWQACEKSSPVEPTSEPGDTNPPSIVIQSPTSESSFVTIQMSLSLGGSAFDNEGLKEIKWSSDRGEAGNAVGLENWTIR